MQEQQIDSVSERQLEVLRDEYKLLVEQIMHWDTHSWTKHQFFLVIQSAFVAGFVTTIVPILLDGKHLTPSLLLLFLGLAGFSCFLCFVWYRTTRRNRDYLLCKVDRAMAIETESHIASTFIQEAEKLGKTPKSHWLEQLMPITFICAWVFLLAIAWATGR